MSTVDHPTQGNGIKSDFSKYFFTVIDVQNILGISKSTAYREIKKMNDELKRKGFHTISGRVPAKYFLERLYC